MLICSNPAERQRNIVLAEGQSYNPVAPYTRTSTIAWPMPLTPVAEGEFLLSTGISSQFPGSNQYMAMDVNGRRLTTSAGGEGDGTFLEGSLITAGGLDDIPTNLSPFALPNSPRPDDEYYDLAQGNSADPNPFLAGGEKSTKAVAVAVAVVVAAHARTEVSTQTFHVDSLASTCAK